MIFPLVLLLLFENRKPTKKLHSDKTNVESNQENPQTPHINNFIFLESLRKRFKTYESSTKGIIEHYAKLNMVREVDASVSKIQVAKAVSEIVQKEFPKALNTPEEFSAKC